MLPLRPVGSFEWLSKDITVQIVKTFLVDPINNICQGIVQILDSDDKWEQYLSSLRQNLFSDVTTSENKEQEKDRRDGSNFSQSSRFGSSFSSNENKTLLLGMIYGNV